MAELADMEAEEAAIETRHYENFIKALCDSIVRDEMYEKMYGLCLINHIKCGMFFAGNAVLFERKNLRDRFLRNNHL